jgi:hypothetical protein
LYDARRLLRTKKILLGLSAPFGPQKEKEAAPAPRNLARAARIRVLCKKPKTLGGCH